MVKSEHNGDGRTPSPPYGYSRECTHSREQQIHIVAEFHANKIRPSRIAYRVGIDIAFIEEMPLGHITQTGRSSGVVYSSEVMRTIADSFEIGSANKDRYGGPAKLSPIVGTKTRVGVISPLSDNFCSDCNRLRLTPDGRLILCLGHENSLDLRQLLRNDTETSKLKRAIVAALTYKPERHVFDQPDEPQVLRFMNATGG